MSPPALAYSRLAGPLSSADAERLASLHVACLPTQMLTMMGGAYLRSFYRFAVSSAQECVFAARENGVIQGVCIVTQDETGVLSRAIASTWMSFLFQAAWRFIFNPEFRQACFAVLKGGPRSSLTPQILILFVSQERAGQGIGEGLVRFAAQAQRDEAALYTKTEDIEGSLAVKFYRKAGFELAERTSYAGREYLYLRLALKDQAPS
jgi:ribosomal protein S18 acetylase RimI-like enzyme